MTSEKIAHIGIAVQNLDESQPFWEEVLGLHFEPREHVEDQKVVVAMGHLGQSHIELLEPTGPDSPIAVFLEKRGQGIHHLCIQVDNIEDALARMKARGMRLIDETWRLGAGGKKVAFVHPKSTGGVLLELSE